MTLKSFPHGLNVEKFCNRKKKESNEKMLEGKKNWKRRIQNNAENWSKESYVKISEINLDNYYYLEYSDNQPHNYYYLEYSDNQPHLYYYTQPSAFFWYFMSNLRVYTESRTEPFIWTSGVDCSNSVNTVTRYKC